MVTGLLRVPRAWMLAALYIFITVVYGSAPVTSCAEAGVRGTKLEKDGAHPLAPAFTEVQSI